MLPDTGRPRFPDWRWRLAKQIARHEIRRTIDDPLVMETVEFLREAGAGSGTSADRGGRRTIAAAKELSVGSDLQRAEINARIIAAQNDKEISRICGVPARVIATYEALFFNVRQHLTAMSWLRRHVIGVGRKLRNAQLAEFWARVALDHGSRTLDRFVDLYRRLSRPGDPLLLSRYLNPDADVDLMLQSGVACALLPGNDNVHGMETAEFWKEHSLAIRSRRSVGVDYDEDLRRAMIQATRAFLSVDCKAFRGVVDTLRRWNQLTARAIQGQRRDTLLNGRGRRMPTPGVSLAESLLYSGPS